MPKDSTTGTFGQAVPTPQARVGSAPIGATPAAPQQVARPTAPPQQARVERKPANVPHPAKPPAMDIRRKQVEKGKGAVIKKTLPPGYQKKGG